MKKSNFKKLLATASAMAVLTGGVGTAVAGAAEKTTVAAVATTLGNGANNANVAGGAGAFNNGDSFYLSHAIPSLDHNGAITIAAIDLFGQGAVKFTTSNDVNLGSVVDTVGNNTMDIEVSTNHTLTLNGTAGLTNGGAVVAANQYNTAGGALGNITLGHKTAKVLIDAAAPVTISGTIDATNAIGDDNGQLIVSSAVQKVTLSGKIGSNKKLSLIEVGSGKAGLVDFKETVSATDITIGKGGNNGIAVFDKTVTATTLKIGDNVGGVGDVTLKAVQNNIGDTTFDKAGSILNINAGLAEVKDNLGNITQARTAAHLEGNVDFANKDSIVNIGDNASIKGNVVSSVADNGTVNFLGAGKVEGDAGTGVIGANAALTKLNFGTAAGGAVHITGTASAKTIDIQNAATAVTIDGAVNATNVNYTAAGELTAKNGIAGDIDFGNNAGTLNVAGGNAGGDITNAGANNATINISGVSNLTGSIGAVAANASIGLIDVSTDGAVTLGAGAKGIFANTLKISNSKSVVSLANAANALTGDVNFAADGVVKSAILNGDITGNVDNVVAAVGGNPVPATGTLEFDLAGSVTEVIGATNAIKVLKVGNGAVTLSKNAANVVHKAATFELSHANSTLTVGNAANGATLDGKVINSAANNKGTINFLGKGEVTGSIGAVGKALENVQADGVNSVVKLSGDKHYSESFSLNNAAAKFIIADKGELHGEVKAANAANEGILEFTGAGEVTGDVGAGQRLALIDLKTADNAEVKFGGNVAATEMKLVNDSVVKFAGNFTGKITASAADKGSIHIADTKEVTLNENSTIRDVTFAGPTSKLTLGKVGNADYKFKTITLGQIGAGELNIAEEATIKAAALDFGTEGREMAKVSFAADKTLTLEDGVNVWAGSVTGGVANRGTIIFRGDNTFSAVGTMAGNSLKAMKVENTGGKIAKLMKDPILSGNLTIDNDAILEVADSLTVVGDIKSANVNNGTMRFVNVNNNIDVNGTVGAVTSLKSIEFAGNSKVEFKAAVVHTAGNAYVFKDGIGKGASVKFVAADVIGGNKFVNESTTETPTVELSLVGNTDFTDAIAENGNGINFQVADGGIDAKVSTNKAAGANFTTKAKDKGVVELNSAGTTINSVGADNLNIAMLTVTENGTVTSGTYAKDITVATNKTATFGGVVKGSGALTLNAAGGAKAIFSDNAVLNHNVTAAAADKGLVEFAGNVTVNNEIGATGAAGKVQSVTFSDDAKFTAKLNKDIHAKTVVMRKGVIAPQTNITLDAETVTVASTTFDSGAHSIATSGTMNFSGDNKINLSIDSNYNVGKPSTIAVTTAGGKLEFEANTKFDVKPSDTNSTPNAGETKIVFVAKNESGADIVKLLDLSNVTVDDEDNFTKWTKAFTAKDGFFLSGSNDSKAALERRLADLADPVDKANIAKLSAAKNDTDAGLFRDKILQTLTKEKTKEALDRIESVTATKAVDAVEGATTHVNNGMSTRMNALTGVQRTGEGSRTVASNDISGINAGDDHARFGAWVSPFYGQAIQKKRKGAAGYKAKSYGASFGFDTRANEDMILGGALTVSNTDLKHRDFKAGDETKISSLMFSIYGMQQITDTWFAQASATFGSSTIKNTEGRTISNSATEQVKGKYNASSFTGEAMFGYNYATEMLTVTPMFGMRYTRVNAGGYKETGSNTNQNLQVSSKASNKFDVVVGARLAGGTFAVDCMTVTPEIHGFIAHDLIGKNANQTAKLEGAEAFTQKSKKPVRTTYNLGLGVNADCGMMEYGAGYDATFADKRVGHQGTLRLRVNF